MYNKRHDEIVGMIEDFIKSGKLKAGDRIPSERFLAEKYRVSRNTVREAIKALAEKAVVISKRGAGTFVAEGALNCMVDAVTRQHLRLKEIFELRMILEPQIARLAANRIAEDDLLALEEVVTAQQAALDSGINNVELDEKFHRLIVKGAGNSVISDIYETLHDVLAESRVRELQSKKRNTLSLESHINIIRAFREKAPEKAAECMHEHMEQVKKNLEHPGKKR